MARRHHLRRTQGLDQKREIVHGMMIEMQVVQVVQEVEEVVLAILGTVDHC